MGEKGGGGAPIPDELALTFSPSLQLALEKTFRIKDQRCPMLRLPHRAML